MQTRVLHASLPSEAAHRLDPSLHGWALPGGVVQAAAHSCHKHVQLLWRVPDVRAPFPSVDAAAVMQCDCRCCSWNEQLQDHVMGRVTWS